MTGEQQYSDLPPGASIVHDPTQQYSDLPPGAKVVNSPAASTTTAQEFTNRMPSGSDIVHAAGLPASSDEALAMANDQAAHPVRTFLKSPAVGLTYGKPVLDALGAVPAMAREGWRGFKGMFSDNPTKQIEAPLHTASAMNPFSAPVTDAMSEHGLGTKEANATGAVGAATLAAGELAPRVGPPVVRGAARGANAILKKAPGAVGASLGAAGAHSVGIPAWMGATGGYALGEGLLPRLKIPGENFNPPNALQLPSPFEGRGAFAPDTSVERPVYGPKGEIETAQPGVHAPDTSIDRPIHGPETQPPPAISPSPYRLRGNQLTEPTTVTPRRVIGPERQLPAHVENTPPAVSRTTPVPADTSLAAPTRPLGPAGASTVPRTLSGEGVLNDVLPSLDNKTLLKIARSRGIDVTPEAQLKEDIGNPKIIRKIINDFSPDELDEVRNRGLETSRNQPVKVDQGKSTNVEAHRFKILHDFFPDVSIPKAMEKRATAAIANRPSGQPGETVAPAPQLATPANTQSLLEQSIEHAKAANRKVGGAKVLEGDVPLTGAASPAAADLSRLKSELKTATNPKEIADIKQAIEHVQARMEGRAYKPPSQAEVENLPARQPRTVEPAPYNRGEPLMKFPKNGKKLQ